MDDRTWLEEDALYRVRPTEDDLIRNLHILYDSICREPVPDYLIDLLKKLPD